MSSVVPSRVRVSTSKLLALVVVFLASWLTGLTIATAEEPAQTPVGFWRTIDDKTGQAKSIVKIAEVNGELHGRIEKLLNQPKNDPDPICRKCPGAQKDKPVKGLEFLWGFKREGKGWSDGYVLDPAEGRVYHANLEVLDGGKRLKVFGYVRVIVKLGRSQVWERVSAP